MRTKYRLTFSAFIGAKFRFAEYLDNVSEKVVVLIEDFQSPATLPLKSEYTGAYTAILEAIPLAIEEACEYEQIWEFRQDTEALWKYRRLHSWTSDSLRAKSTNEASELIRQRIEDYAWALDKHGILTVTGALKTIIQPDALLSAATAAIITGIQFGQVAASITTGLLLSARTILQVVEFLAEKKSIERGQFSECALIYEIRKEFSKHDSKMPRQLDT